MNAIFFPFVGKQGNVILVNMSGIALISVPIAQAYDIMLVVTPTVLLGVLGCRCHGTYCWLYSCS